MASSLCCDPPGADVIDFMSSSCVVGIFNGITRVEGIGSDEAGDGAVADGITTSAGRGTAIGGCTGSTAMAGWGTGTAGATTGAFVLTEMSGIATVVAGGFVTVPTCPQTANGASIIETKIPAYCRAAVILVKVLENARGVQFSSGFGRAA
jgi:hypothetical protein